MRIRVYQHVPFESTGSIGAWMDRRGVTASVTRFFAGDLPPNRPDADLLVVMGGPMGVHDGDRFPWLAAEIESVAAALAAGTRVLGVCLGAQVIAAALGATVTRNPEKEIGWFPVTRPAQAGPDAREPAAAIPDGFPVFHWHGERFDLPRGARLLLSSAGCENQAFSRGPGVLALQFHLEMTVDGARALVRNCPADLAPGPWTQEASELAAGTERFAAANRVMDAVLDRLADGLRP